MSDNKQSLNSRIRKLEQAAQDPDERGPIMVLWGNPGEPELKPGDYVIEWGPNDQITKRRVKGKADANKNPA